MAQPAWHTRPVFVSSTFRDMQAERDHLRDVVFPALARAPAPTWQEKERRALKYFQKRLTIAEDLRRRAPGSAEYARDLVVSYIKMASWYQKQRQDGGRSYSGDSATRRCSTCSNGACTSTRPCKSCSSSWGEG